MTPSLDVKHLSDRVIATHVVLDHVGCNGAGGIPAQQLALVLEYTVQVLVALFVLLLDQNQAAVPHDGALQQTWAKVAKKKHPAKKAPVPKKEKRKAVAFEEQTPAQESDLRWNLKHRSGKIKLQQARVTELGVRTCFRTYRNAVQSACPM